MKYLLLFFFGLFNCTQSLRAQTLLYAQPTDSTIVTNTYTKGQVTDDLDFMLKVIGQAHPNRHHAVTKQQLQQYRDSVVQALPPTLTLYQTSFALSAVVAQLDEGHLGFVTHPEQWKHFQREALVFPFSIYKITPNAVIIQKDVSANKNLAPFDTIVAINGVPVQQLVRKYSNMNGGLDCWRKRHIQNNFHFLLFADSIRSPFRVQAYRQGRLKEFEVAGNAFPAPKSSNAVATGSPSYYTYNLLNDSTAYLNFRRMRGSHKTFIAFLDSTFADIKARGITKLVVDLRYNGGGDPRMGKILLSYLTRKPYRLQASRLFKFSKPSKEFQYDLVNSSIPKPIRFLLKLVPNGLTHTTRYKVMAQPVREPFFSGEFCFLIGPGTFSSANMLAAAIKDFGLGTLIGEATCEPATDYGEMMAFMLPNTHLIATTPSEYFTRPNGDTGNVEGISPDFEVKPTPADRLNGHDPILDFAARWLSR